MLVSRLVSIHKHVVALCFSALAFAAYEQDANAQIHGDVGVNVGIMRRIKTGGFGDGAFGPVGEIEAHIAVIPLLRVGAYASHDIAPNDTDGSAWQITSAGLHVKVLAPFVRGAYRAWLFTGFGYAGVYAPSYNKTYDFQDSQGPRNTDVTGAGGSFFEVPVGVGFGWRFSKPWELVAQLGVRWDFDFVGSLYDERAAIPQGGPVYAFKSLGNDTWAPFLTVGIALDL